AAAADLAGEGAAAGTGGVVANAAARRGLRLLPGRCEDERRLFPRLPVVLEHRGVLPVRAAAGARRGGGAAGGLRGAAVLAGPLPLRVAARQAQPVHERAGGGVVPVAGVGPGDAPEPPAGGRARR